MIRKNEDRTVSRKQIRDINFLEIVQGKKYGDIFNRIGEKGLMTAAATFTKKCLDEFSVLKQKKSITPKKYRDFPYAPDEEEEEVDEEGPIEYTGLTLEEAEHATNLVLQEPLSESLTNLNEIAQDADKMDELEDVDFSDYSKMDEDVHPKVVSELKKIGVIDAVINNSLANINTEDIEEIWDLEGREEIRQKFKDILESPIGVNYISHCFVSAMLALGLEQLNEMGGIEDVMATDPKPLEDVSEGLSLDAKDWQDKLERSEPVNEWFRVLRMAGAVTSTSSGTSPLFNISYGKHMKKNPTLCQCEKCIKGGNCNGER